MRRDEFFDVLYRDADFDGQDHIGVFTLPNKKNRQFQNIADMLEHVDAARESQNVFFCVQPMRKVNSGRGDVKDATRLVSLIADVDYGKDPKGKKNRFDNQDDAVKFLNQQCGLKPSAIISSGGGIHGYWFLNESIPILTTNDRIEAQTLSKRWSRSISHRAKAMSISIDSVFDLARVLRCPGSINLKLKDTPRPCNIISDWKPLFYDPEHFQALFVDDEDVKELEPLSGETTAWDRNASVSMDLMESAFELDPRFSTTWRMQRKDLQDDSFSGYEMALANCAVGHGWRDEHIFDLLVNFRRKHNGDMAKVCRRDYLERTVRAARHIHKRDVAIETVDRFVPVDDEFEESEDDSPSEKTKEREKERDAARNAISAVLGVQVERFIQHGKETPQYYLVLKSGKDIPLGNVAALRTQEKFQNAMVVHLHRQPLTFKRDRWLNFINMLLRIVEVQEDESDGRYNMFLDWVNSYMAGRKIYEAERAWVGISNKAPFWHTDRAGNKTFNIPAMSFKDHVNQVAIDRPTRAVFAAVMRKGNARKVQRTDRTADKVPVSCACWELKTWPIKQKDSVSGCGA